MVCAVANQKGRVGKTTTAINVSGLLARRSERVLVIDTDPQFALTRQLGIDVRALTVNLVDVLAGRAPAQDAMVAELHSVDVIPGAGEIAGVVMSLAGEMDRERFLQDALEFRCASLRAQLPEVDLTSARSNSRFPSRRGSTRQLQTHRKLGQESPLTSADFRTLQCTAPRGNRFRGGV